MRVARSALAIPALVLVAAAAAACSGKPSGDGHAGHDHGTAAGGHADHGTAETAAKGREALKKIGPSANYPLTTCVVSGDKLDAMGERMAFEYQGREVQFCCDGCIDEFLEDPAKFTGKLPAAPK